MKAIIETGGKQYSVTEGSEIYVEKLDAEVGKKLFLTTCLWQMGLLEILM